ncbi:MAG: hypothetical protein MHM6MM_009298, partial [Cercozoa sp. M6MM]
QVNNRDERLEALLEKVASTSDARTSLLRQHSQQVSQLRSELANATAEATQWRQQVLQMRAEQARHRPVETAVQTVPLSDMIDSRHMAIQTTWHHATDRNTVAVQTDTVRPLSSVRNTLREVRAQRPVSQPVVASFGTVGTPVDVMSDMSQSNSHTSHTSHSYGVPRQYYTRPVAPRVSHLGHSTHLGQLDAPTITAFSATTERDDAEHAIRSAAQEIARIRSQLSTCALELQAEQVDTDT